MPLPSLKSIILNIIVALVLGFLGPFGSYAMPLFQRLLYWFILFNLGYFFYHFSHKITERLFQNKNIHPVFTYITPSLLAAIPLSILVGFATSYSLGHGITSIKYILYVLPQVLILGIVIDSVMRLIHIKLESQGNQVVPGESFINRLPAKIGTELICFEMEDHYLVVYTEKGNHMMLMRMKDALIELNDFEGMQVHRSYWVAFDGIMSVKKEARKIILIMKNGMEIPVSRKHQEFVRDKVNRL